MSKLKKTSIIVGVIVGTLCSFWGLVNIIPPKKVINENPWIAKDQPMISAHRGGAFLNPENTEKAFDYVIIETNYCDIVEIDIHKTKDGVLVINHDDSMDRMCLDDERKETDITKDIVIKDTNYKDLLQYNMGRNFVDSKGNKPYETLTIEQAKEQNLTIMTLEEFLIKYQQYNFKLYLEIKEPNTEGINEANKTVDMVYELFERAEYSSWKNRTMIISFTDSLIDYIVEKYPDLYVGALGYKIAPQLIATALGLTTLIPSKYHSFQTQMNNSAGPIKINCATKAFVRASHRRNQSITYWTINNEKEMDKLIKIGADVITTNAPDVLAKKLGKN